MIKVIGNLLNLLFINLILNSQTSSSFPTALLFLDNLMVFVEPPHNRNSTSSL